MLTKESILFLGPGVVPSEIASGLTAWGWQVRSAVSVREGLELLKEQRCPVAVVDLGSFAPQAMEALRSVDPDIAVLLVHSPEEKPLDGLAAPGLRPAAFLAKPIHFPALSMAIDSALVYRRLLEENRSLKRQLGTAVSLSDWVGCTPEAQEVRKAITTAALSSGPVLLVGEDGSGRRLAAELIHRQGRSASSSFLPIELTSLPKGEIARLLEELMGSASATFAPYSNGALRRPGSLYLSELTALCAADQETLAAYLERPLSFRIMVSADPSIHHAVRLGRFDGKLFECISALTITLPPLRDRQGDIPVLIDHFLRRFCARLQLQPLGIPSKAIERFTAYDWPGNVAELSMVIERAVSIASAAKFEGTTLPEQFWMPPSITGTEPSRLRNVSLRELLADIEKRIILQTLERVDGSQKRAAERLRLNPTTLHEKMKRYKILPERPRPRSAPSLSPQV